MHKVQGVPFRMIMFDDIQGCLWRIQVAYPSSTTSALSMETSAASIEIQSARVKSEDVHTLTPYFLSVPFLCSCTAQLRAVCPPGSGNH